MKKAIYLMLHLYSKVFPVNFYCELPGELKTFIRCVFFHLF